MEVKKLLTELTGKKYITLTYRGNDAIKQVVDLFQDKTIIIPDQGGWLTYKKYPKKFEILETKDGLINPESLTQYKNQVLLLHSLGGYFTEQPMKQISNVCEKNKIILINDVAGSIGTDLAKYGDYIVGSFGDWKPINFGYGGFIATNKKEKFNETFDNRYIDKLLSKLKELNQRLTYLNSLSKQVKKDLSDYNILNRSHKSLVVIVEYKNEQEKNEIIKYCNKNKLEYTQCPRYIRVNKQAISIEIKRQIQPQSLKI